MIQHTLDSQGLGPLAHIANNEEEADEESICRRNRFFQKKEKNGPYKNKRKCN